MINRKYCCCNLCGKPFDMWDYEEDFHIHTLLGYGTAYDGDELHLRLCCSCMNDIIDSCYFSPITEIDYDLVYENNMSKLKKVVSMFGYEVGNQIARFVKRIKEFFFNMNIKNSK